mmetsp:Transcript_16410/g.37980  ORF Transcript_16410/g.37980 Transcript_16410/m.37980 type:complete len:217 (-) Transcript_16410:1154-1804(-)
MKKTVNSSFIVMILALCNASFRSAGAFNPITSRRLGVKGAANATERRLFNLFGSAPSSEYPIMTGEETMSQRGHGTSEKPVQKNLKWNCDYQTADRICNFNRHYAEFAGYWESTSFLKSIQGEDGPIKFYDSVTGAHLFTAPIGRSWEDFIKESRSHGWPSFRDQEVNWEGGVRCLKNGECISDTGTHLGHNLPDRSGNRYCINLVSVAGQPDGEN